MRTRSVRCARACARDPLSKALLRSHFPPQAPVASTRRFGESSFKVYEKADRKGRGPKRTQRAGNASLCENRRSREIRRPKILRRTDGHAGRGSLIPFRSCAMQFSEVGSRKSRNQKPGRRREETLSCPPTPQTHWDFMGDTQHGPPPEGLECLVTFEDITAEDKNLCEYQTAPSGQWQAAKMTCEVVEMMRSSQ
eukprot:scaffold78_cov265-Pinguiococcus_pyrenoidosus.AAC.3